MSGQGLDRRAVAILTTIAACEDRVSGTIEHLDALAAATGLPRDQVAVEARALYEGGLVQAVDASNWLGRDELLEMRLLPAGRDAIEDSGAADAAG
jgi:hypothetical protein